jgi:hypothetical protein
MRHKAYSPIHDAPSTKTDAKRTSGSKVTAFQVHEQGQCICPVREAVAEYEPPAAPRFLSLPFLCAGTARHARTRGCGPAHCTADKSFFQLPGLLAGFFFSAVCCRLDCRQLATPTPHTHYTQLPRPTGAQLLGLLSCGLLFLHISSSTTSTACIISHL